MRVTIKTITFNLLVGYKNIKDIFSGSYREIIEQVNCYNVSHEVMTSEYCALISPVELMSVIHMCNKRPVISA